MPIKPIDLQTLFTQMDKVARQNAAERDAAVAQKALLGATMQKKAVEEASSVKKLEEDKSGPGAVKDKQDETAAGAQSENKQKKEQERDQAEQETVQDPALGGHIDISG
ncbi:MAG TPA: hypothetical protein PK625_07815 [Spirochaetales bacterium]|nr:hypothetical protein [Spirochaetales bacterium]MBP7264052.1 hypothetical protein [Spirochaetia bacterium]HPE37040.1 hypothetical protein [Spirochaetales bacterium]